jgi:hypothetical protein
MRHLRAILLLIVFAVAGTAHLTAQARDDFERLVEDGQLEELQERYLALATDQDVSAQQFVEIEHGLLDLAKERVVASDYETALFLLELILTVNLDNLEAQDIYVAVIELNRGQIPGSAGATASAVTSPAEQEGRSPLAREPEEQTSRVVERALVPEEQVPERGVPDEASPPETVATTIEATPPEEVAPPAEITAATDAAPSERVPPTEATAPQETPGVPAVEPPESRSESALPALPPNGYAVHLAPVSILVRSSGFYADVFGNRRIESGYGLSFEAFGVFFFPRVALGGHVAIQTHFANLTASRGDALGYEVAMRAGLPGLTQLPLFLRIGFTQQWYFYGAEDPDVLITSFPTPTLGFMINEVQLADRVRFEASLDYYLISFFTQYMTAGLDGTAAILVSLPIVESLGLSARVAVSPQLLLSYSNVEFMTRLEISIGISRGDTYRGVYGAE